MRTQRPRTWAEALADVGEIPPWGIDVATGVEGADRREGSGELMKAFVAAVRERARSASKSSGTEEA